eukprot:g17516.t1
MPLVGPLKAIVCACSPAMLRVKPSCGHRSQWEFCKKRFIRRWSLAEEAVTGVAAERLAARLRMEPGEKERPSGFDPKGGGSRPSQRNRAFEQFYWANLVETGLVKDTVPCQTVPVPFFLSHCTSMMSFSFVWYGLATLQVAAQHLLYAPEIFKSWDECCSKDCEWEVFLECLSQPLPLTLWITPTDRWAEHVRGFMRQYKAEAQAAVDQRISVQPLPWMPADMGWRVDIPKAVLRKDAKFKLLHEMLIEYTSKGTINRMEEARRCVDAARGSTGHPSRAPLLGFMCCAGQQDRADAGQLGTRQLQEVGESRDEGIDYSGDEGCVVANEISAERAGMLVHQIARHQSLYPLVVFTSHDARYFPSLRREDGREVLFDRILCDVMCSSDGTLRKSPHLWREWSSRLSLELHAEQLAVALRSVRLLRGGGRMCLRILPHHNDTGGFFIAVFEKVAAYVAKGAEDGEEEERQKQLQKLEQAAERSCSAQERAKAEARRERARSGGVTSGSLARELARYKCLASMPEQVCALRAFYGLHESFPVQLFFSRHHLQLMADGELVQTHQGEANQLLLLAAAAAEVLCCGTGEHAKRKLKVIAGGLRAFEKDRFEVAERSTSLRLAQEAVELLAPYLGLRVQHQQLTGAWKDVADTHRLLSQRDAATAALVSAGKSQLEELGAGGCVLLLRTTSGSWLAVSALRTRKAVSLFVNDLMMPSMRQASGEEKGGSVLFQPESRRVLGGVGTAQRPPEPVWQDFEPLQAAPDVGFWQELSQRKLDLWRLDSSNVPVTAFYEASQASRVPAKCFLQKDAFQDTRVPVGAVKVVGELRLGM